MSTSQLLAALAQAKVRELEDEVRSLQNKLGDLIGMLGVCKQPDCKGGKWNMASCAPALSADVGGEFAQVGWHMD